YQSVLQTAQLLATKQPQNGWQPSAIGENRTAILIRRRYLKVAVHTGCRCRCRANPYGLCPSTEKHQFMPDTCQCRCRNQNQSAECAKRSNEFGVMFWDQDQCRCRCPQFLESYLYKIDPPVQKCSTGNRFDDKHECRYVNDLFARKNVIKSKLSS